MDKRKWRKCRQGIGLCLAITTFMQQGNFFPVSASELKTDSVEETTYVVMAEDAAAYNDILEDYEDVLVNEEAVVEETEPITGESLEYLEDNNIALLELTSEEAEQLEEKSDVLFVEEDILFEGSAKKKADKKVGKQSKKEDVNEENETESEAETETEEIVEDISEEVYDASKDQWNLSAIHWNPEQVGGEAVRVAVLDSGVMWHEDIDVAADIRLVPGDEEADSMYMDPSGHGTGMASIIAGKINQQGINGINPNAEIYSIEILDSNNQSSLSRVVSGIYRAIEEDCKIINMSFGTTVYSDILYKAVCDAYDNGILMVAAAGNHAGTVEYPAAFGEVMAVGATRADGTWMEDTAGGEEVEILAPGDQIVTDGPLDGIYIESGTSLSTAQVTGAASLLWSKDSSKSADYVRKLLSSTSQRIETEEMPAGVLDVENSLQQMGIFETYYEENPVEHMELQSISEIATGFDAGNLVNGYWGAGAHEELIDHAVSACTVTVDHMKRMKNVAKDADATYSDTKMLHGQGNYVRGLKFLYTCADKVRNGQKSAAAVTAAISEVGLNTANEEEAKLADATKKTIASASGSMNKYYAVMGLVMHLAGDIYAHRTIVPKGTAISKTYFEGEYCTLPEDSELMKWAANSKAYAGSIYKYKNVFDKTVDLKVMECRDIQNYMVNKEKSRGDFEDNKNFLKERFSRAKGVSKRVFETSHKKGGFDAVYFFVPNTSGPKLNNLKGYMNSAGCSTNIGSKRWSDYSTDSCI